MKENGLSRRTFIGNTSILAAGMIVGSFSNTGCGGDEKAGLVSVPAGVERVVKNGRINQSVAKWPFHIKKIPFEELCAAARKMGIKAIDFLEVSDLSTVKKYGLVCSMLQSHTIERGMNNKKYHSECLEKLRESIDAAAEYGFGNVISFSGLGEETSEEDGLANAVAGFKQIVGYGEQKKVTICVEYLNSKVNHPGYMFDHLDWGIKLCDKVGSENLKILFDIYHVQIMEGDIIRKIRKYHQYFGHYHTAGVPGRNEIDETQEVYYPAIMCEIVKTGYSGYVGHEFIPKREPLVSLAEAVRICDI